eukprot:299980-Chlamydomonas_euryale.AAC.1
MAVLSNSMFTCLQVGAAFYAKGKKCVEVLRFARESLNTLQHHSLLSTVTDTAAAPPAATILPLQGHSQSMGLSSHTQPPQSFHCKVTVSRWGFPLTPSRHNPSTARSQSVDGAFLSHPAARHQLKIDGPGWDFVILDEAGQTANMCVSKEILKFEGQGRGSRLVPSPSLFRLFKAPSARRRWGMAEVDVGLGPASRFVRSFPLSLPAFAFFSFSVSRGKASLFLGSVSSLLFPLSSFLFQ